MKLVPPCAPPSLLRLLLTSACALTCLAQLNLFDNYIGSEGAKVLAAGLAANGSLTKILVSYNKLGDEGATVLCDALRGSKVTKVQELDLKLNQIGPAGAKAVASMAAVVASMTWLDVGLNSMGDDGKAALRKAIEGRSGFELLL